MKIKSIGSALNGLRGHEVVVELKNDSMVRGIMDEGDWGLNIVLRNASIESLCDREGTMHVEQLMLAGKSIRFVHLPPTIDFRSAANQYVASTSRILKKSQPTKLK